MKDDVGKVPLDANDFVRNDAGKIIAKSQANIAVALELLAAQIRYNEFSDQILIEGLEDHKLLDDAALIRLWFVIST
jgi:hypothetical protein